ncbi:MAG: hypothetical protein FWF96_05400 [Kiritimatiellaeota bacterium]|nr:hypothetical protein [Kiritimatiellota bacterium]
MKNENENQPDEKKARAKPLVKQLRGLYGREARIHGLDPWKWLSPTDIFGIQREGCEPVFVCFNTIVGAFKTVDVALGWNAYDMLLRVHTQKVNHPAFYFETRMFQFGRLDPARLYPMEVANHARHGFPPDADGRIPFFRSHQVGRVPWPVNRVEAAFLDDVMHVVFGMAMRLEDFHEPVGSRAMEEVYMMPMDNEGRLGEPHWVPVPEIPGEIQADVNLPGELLKRVRELPAGAQPMEIGHVFLPYFPGKYPANTPPRTGYLFILATPGKGRRAEVLLFTLHAEESASSVWSGLPVRILDAIATQTKRPPEIKVTDSRLMALLRPLTELLPLKLTRAGQLPLIGRECQGVLKAMGLPKNIGL